MPTSRSQARLKSYTFATTCSRLIVTTLNRCTFYSLRGYGFPFRFWFVIFLFFFVVEPFLSSYLSLVVESSVVVSGSEEG